ncbi:hypothetical protein CN995_10145 [Bacillus cereus]|uniref:hypothetical protein n=1 Tax=Bacillus cereus TaxID=1396 RepID=UPI000BF2501B|nr:hypothetical protein [Bacillus cereus]PFD01864.1 hypothetical protein CN289_20755 [Bacillus cereus]PFK65230.1 hypothetical protein COJ25_25960 [Bacillus cereus]PGO13655.1 hypothetical protein CN970_12050 [Bacillus cereus]PGP05891.1 hypothetical protein CN995_10145 [Bacillus cereus]
MDLLEDLNNILRTEFEKLGYPTPKKDTHDLLTAFFNLQDKTVRVKRRKVHISKELGAKEIEKPYNDYLKQIRNKFKNGKDINPHLSKFSMRPYKEDLLLYDWGIHHLHLNNKLDDKGFIMRSDYLLFFVLKEDDVYFIDVTKHKLEDRTEFSQQHLLRIVKRNWPHLLEPFKMSGVSGLSEKSDDKAHSSMRNSGITTPVEIDGEVFCLMGGGISTAKTNIAHTKKADDISRSLKGFENDLKIGQKECKEITSEFKIPPIETDFKLVLEDKVFYIIEINSGNKAVEAKGLFKTIFGHLINH